MILLHVQALDGLALRGDDLVGLTGEAEGFVAADGVFLSVDAGSDFDVILRKKLLRASAGDSTLAVIGPGNGLHTWKLSRQALRGNDRGRYP